MHFNFLTRRIEHLTRGGGGFRLNLRGGGAMVVLFCKTLPLTVLGNIPFHKGNE